MKTRPTAPRITPLELDQLTEEQRTMAGIGADTVIRVLVRHETLFKPLTTLGLRLLIGEKTTMRDRELAILRVARRAQAPYEWANHVGAALAGGATGEEIDLVADDAAVWPSRADAVLMQMTDELCADDCISDETWAALKETRTDLEIVELIFVVGFYRAMAGFLNSVGVPVEAGKPTLGTR